MDWWWADRIYPAHDFVDPPKAEKYEALAKINAKFSHVVDERRLDIVVRQDKPTIEQALEIVKEHYHVHAKARGIFEGTHRDHKFSAAPNASDAAHMQPPDLHRLVEEMKRLYVPFLFIAIHKEYGAAAHGWCNGSNFGRYELESMARCAELNIRQELAKCGESSTGRREMPILGQGHYKLPSPR